MAKTVVTKRQLLKLAERMSSDTDVAVQYLRNLGYRVTFATLDRYGVPYWHLWVGKTPILMSSDTVRQRAKIEIMKRANPVRNLLPETLLTAAVSGVGVGAGFWAAKKVLKNPGLKTLAEVRKTIKPLKYPGDAPPYWGRERSVIIYELAKAGYRLCGWYEKPDAFLVDYYKMANVRQVNLPGEYKGFRVWVGRPTTAEGRKELVRLVRETLPKIEYESLPPDLVKEYVRNPRRRKARR